MGGAVASDAFSGLTVCGAADGAAILGASARGGAEAIEAREGGAVAIGAPSGPILIAGAQTAAESSGAGAGAVVSKPDKARFGATSAFP